MITARTHRTSLGVVAEGGTLPVVTSFGGVLPLYWEKSLGTLVSSPVVLFGGAMGNLFAADNVTGAYSNEYTTQSLNKHSGSPYVPWKVWTDLGLTLQWRLRGVVQSDDGTGEDITISIEWASIANTTPNPATNFETITAYTYNDNADTNERSIDTGWTNITAVNGALRDYIGMQRIILTTTSAVEGVTFYNSLLETRFKL